MTSSIILANWLGALQSLKLSTLKRAISRDESCLVTVPFINFCLPVAPAYKSHEHNY